MVFFKQCTFVRLESLGLKSEGLPCQQKEYSGCCPISDPFSVVGLFLAPLTLGAVGPGAQRRTLSPPLTSDCGLTNPRHRQPYSHPRTAAPTRLRRRRSSSSLSQQLLWERGRLRQIIDTNHDQRRNDCHCKDVFINDLHLILWE